MNIKRILALLLAAAMLGTMPVLADGGEEPAPDDLFLLGESSEYGDVDILDDPYDDGEDFAYVPEESTPFMVAPLYEEDEFYSEDASFSSMGMTADGGGSLFDPRGSGYLNNVRNQGSWNTCWAIAAMTAAEMNGISYGLLNNDPDLSERHLLYFLAHQADDPLGNSSGDYNTNPTFWFKSGGNPVVAAMTLASWHGAASESATGTPYSGLSGSDYVDSKYAYTDVLHLENTYSVDLSTSAGREALKSMIPVYGGAVLQLYYDSAYLFAGSPSQSSAGTTDSSTPASKDAEGSMDKPATDAADPEATAAPAPLTEEPETVQTEAAQAAVDPGEPVILPEESFEDAAETPQETTEAPQEVTGEQTGEAPGADPAIDPAGDVPVITDPPTPEPMEDGSGEAELTEADDILSGLPEEIVPPEESESAALDGAAEEAVIWDDTGAAEEDSSLDDKAEDGFSPDDAMAVDGNAADFTVCYYQNARTGTNHEVVIVGWDDSYPRQNFGYSSKGAVPPKNGAWLCRNSHGSTWQGGDGYFWVSYYDASVSAVTDGSIHKARATVFEFGSSGNYQHNYEYDGAAVLGYVNDSIGGKGVSTQNASGSTRRSYANIFTANGNSAERGSENLRAVSTYTYGPGVSYTVKVYTGLKDALNPASGTLAAETSGTFSYAGFHTVTLPEAVTLRQNERFSVVFTVGRDNNSALYVPACYTSTNWYSVNDSQTGQSFVSLDGSSWTDCKGLKNAPNVRIKAYTDDGDVLEDPPAVDPSAAFPFTDVSESAWYYGDVETCWRSGLLKGMTDTTFVPGGTATRAQIVAVLHRLSGNGAPEQSTVSFGDVSAGAWYYDDVRWAESLGIINGSDDDGDGVFSFRPNDSITRQEFMTVLYRYAKQQNADVSATDSLSAFSDSGKVSGWARDAVVWSVGSGLQKGMNDSSGNLILSPAGKVTRAQLAAFLNRFSAML